MRHLHVAAGFCLSVVVAQQASATSPFGATPLCDPLQQSHLIVRGVVVDNRDETMTLGQWGAVPENDQDAGIRIGMSLVRVSVEEVLKGKWTDKEIVFRVRDQPWLLERGKEYVICGLWRQVQNGGFFVTEPGIGFYVKESNGWTACTSSRIHPGEGMKNEDMVSRIREADVAHVTAAADVVARGTVIKTWDPESSNDPTHDKRATHYELRVIETLKGPSRDTLDLVVSPGLCVPRGMAPGQEWLVFLKSGEGGFFPFAGRNSLLKVESDRLIFDMSVEFPETTDKVRRTVRAEVSQ